MRGGRIGFVGYGGGECGGCKFGLGFVGMVGIGGEVVVFPRNQLLVVNGDRLIEDPVSELEKIESFLGLEHRIGRHNFYFNRTKGFYCLRNDTADKCLRESKGRRHPRVDPKVLTKLRRFYVEHNQKFYELVGEDLGWPEK
ncbi:unnamed protein product [Nezara viridula]|uniref:Sulfotransferase domain-containing protein n=1 Tax=Nezara viridula TaxID=85310 RepID=A0A9P0MUN7_NEZVI|nr:unnamed protein product [Nezara viridula]